jgi:predicted DNA-binding transcriptional regulator AlpA
MSPKTHHAVAKPVRKRGKKTQGARHRIIDARFAFAEKAAQKRKQHGPARVIDLASVRARLEQRVGLLDKFEVLAVVGCTFPTLWKWMRYGDFPPSFAISSATIRDNTKTRWRAADVADWLAGLKPRRLKPADTAVADESRAAV